MPKPKHPYFDVIFEELSELDNVRPRSMFGHQGYAFGTSVFAFLDNERLIVRSEKFPEGSKLPAGISYFMPDIFTNRVWIGLEFDDSLRSLRTHWHLIEESYQKAILREEAKANTARKRGKRSAPATNVPASRRTSASQSSSPKTRAR